MNIQRLRNLTTGRLHTEMGDIYKDLEFLTGMEGLFTHMLPRALTAVTPWLKEEVTDPRFWDGEFDQSHIGEIEIPTPTDEDRKKMLAIYMDQPNPLEGKEVIVAAI